MHLNPIFISFMIAISSYCFVYATTEEQYYRNEDQSNGTSIVPTDFEGKASVWFPMRRFAYNDGGVRLYDHWKVYDCRPKTIRTMKHVVNDNNHTYRLAVFAFGCSVILMITCSIIFMQIQDDFLAGIMLTLAVVFAFSGIGFFIRMLMYTSSDAAYRLEICEKSFRQLIPLVDSLFEQG